MEKKQLGAVSLLAGTAIGSGMISLPIVLINFGIIGSLFLMIFFCWVTYISAMVRCELNLNSQADFSLKDVGFLFGGKIAANIGDISLKILSFALLSAYIFGASSIIHSFLSTDISFATIIIIFIIIIFVMFLFFSNFLVKINKYLFVILFSFVLAGVIGLTFCSKTRVLPLGLIDIWHWKSWSTVTPIVFTSFGFQGSLHSLTKFVNNDRELIKRACLWGGIIPVIVYSLWVVCVLTIIFNSDQASFQKMLINPINVSELINILSRISNIQFLQQAVWIVSFLAILTSIIGVGLALDEILKKDLNLLNVKKSSSLLNFLKLRNISDRQKSCISLFIMIIPSAIVAIFVPNAFIRILNFAGIILAILAIILPIFLFKRMKKSLPIKNSIFRKNFSINIIFIVGGLIIFLGFFDIFM
ncbi:MAG: hypothetical protein LBI26_00545 [Holosporales bacterium]|jgi:tyrosine-specific transport protein|nr:hypothetical protein [Holosporales bacterium]